VSTPVPSFEQLFTEHTGFAWRVLHRHGVAERELEDACQEVFMVVLKNLPQFEGRASPRTWIYAICRRVAANHRRRAASQREIPVDAPPERAGEPTVEGEAFEELARKQGLLFLEELLARLPAAQREVFALYEIEELTMREVAEALECSQNTAFARLYAARRAVDAALKRWRARRRVA
jgi:RNA polymerase sigma-70 factor (ECF subfamily)